MVVKRRGEKKGEGERDREREIELGIKNNSLGTEMLASEKIRWKEGKRES